MLNTQVVLLMMELDMLLTLETLTVMTVIHGMYTYFND